MIVINRQYCRFDSQILRSFSPGCPVGIKLRSVVSFTADYLYDRFHDTFSYTWSATKCVWKHRNGTLEEHLPATTFGAPASSTAGS